MTTYAPQTTDPHAPAWARTGSHLAGAAETFLAAVNAHWPNRSKASDGTIGDARHIAEGSGSDHCPWLNGTVRAVDITADGIDAAWLAEHLRMLGEAGDHRLARGGYVIHNRQITLPDFSGWAPYTGADPHVTHVHLSLTRDPAGYEDRGPWPTLSTVQPAPPHPAPIAQPTADHPDLTGAGEGLRGDEGDQGQRVAELQAELVHYAPAYAHDPDGSALDVDGVWGPNTSHVLAEYEHREAREADTPAGDRAGLAAGDGRNIGPRAARALHRDGFHA